MHKELVQTVLNSRQLPQPSRPPPPVMPPLPVLTGATCAVLNQLQEMDEAIPAQLCYSQGTMAWSWRGLLCISNVYLTRTLRNPNLVKSFSQMEQAWGQCPAKQKDY